MKALVKSKREPGLWLEEIPEPAIGIGDVLIRVRRAGICGTDLHIYNWDRWAQGRIHPPLIPVLCAGTVTPWAANQDKNCGSVKKITDHSIHF